MIQITEPGYAKINLTLDVLGLRPDGYHELESVMQTVSLCDDVELTLGTKQPWCLLCDTEGVPTDQRNLAWKAAKLFFAHLGIDPDGLTIKLNKRIPAQAGLGGGSSDAAAVLRGLNRHYGSAMDPYALAELSVSIGSDIPFCVLGGTVMCKGRGEQLRPLDAMPDCTIVICKPAFSMSTPLLYKTLDEQPKLCQPNNRGMETALHQKDLSAVASLLCNVFDPVVSARYPLMDTIRWMYLDHGAMGCQMSGSGSAFFGIMPDESSAKALCAHLATIVPEYWITRPVNP